MVDTIKRLAGPVLPGKTAAGSTLYTPGGGVKAAVKNAVITNTHGSRSGFVTLSIGTPATKTNRLVSGLLIPPRTTEIVELDVVLDNGAGDTLQARQSMGQDPSSLILANRIVDTDTTSAVSYATSSWAATNNNSSYLMTIIHTAASAPAAPNSFTDTHAGFTWTLVQSVTNVAAGTNGEFIRIDQYRAQSTGTTNTTTTVGFAANQSSCLIIIDEIQGSDTSGTHGSEAIVELEALELAATLQSAMFGTDPGGCRIASFAHGANEATNPGTGMTELGDTSVATPNTGGQTSYTFNALLDPSASWTTTTTRRLATGVDVMDSIRSINVTLNGVEIT